MHELSLATALIEQVRRHAPPGVTVTAVRITAGAMRAIEPDTMQQAWRVATAATELDGTTLELTVQPYRLTCPACGQSWRSEDLYESCACGSPGRPVGDDALTLDALEVDEPDAPQETTPWTSR